ncbi:HNH endonuclease [Pseudomonas sp. BEA3.1]|uniref:HNH endonuclease n=1 Tax=Pseudomonas sp. BEA3.1 TaxID=3083251 RepID=UPI002963EA95|nr:HNH endonuclease [Pseudomonas sp. BEA3.1]MDW2776325.1 HNH endonuclease [Pseudomonas sp. BEA3.1]
MRPIIFEGSNLEFVSCYDGINHSIWNTITGPMLPLRAAIREHYIREQGYKCAYCRQIKRETHGSSWDVEHIIAKSEHPRFLFEPENLALVCKECNLSKSNKDVLTKRLREKSPYPRDKESFSIIHPHYDTYSDHMDISILSGKIIFIPKNKHKGRETFDMCNLVRFSYEYGGWDSFNYGLTKEVSNFLKNCPANATPQKISELLGFLNTTVDSSFSEEIST